MRYLSVCSGIEAASVAWHPLGWKPFGFAEIEPFPSAVLAHHYPNVPNFGDMTRFEEWPDAAIDVLVGGTPCQDFSVAGLRAGMDGVRGSLTLTYAAIARKYRSRWLAWENVPGVLSSNEGRDFASLLGLLSGRRIEIPAGGWKSAGIIPGYEHAYGLAWRVLDAQFVRVDGFERAVPQRRRRVFVVGYLGDWRRAAAVLLERESLSGNPPPRREAGKAVAPTISARTHGGGGLGTDFDCDGGLIASTGDVAHCLNAGGMGRQDYETETVIATAHALRAEGFDASEDGTGRGTPIVPVVAASLTRGAESAGKGGYAGRRQEDDYNIVAFAENSRSEIRLCGGDGRVAAQLTTGGGKPGQGQPCVAQPFTLAIRGRGDSHNLEYRQDGTSNAILTPNGGRAGMGVGAVAFAHQQGGNIDLHLLDECGFTLQKCQTQAVQVGWSVRRLTPTECERLQGFPDGYTQITHRNKPAADGPRYKALGNSMAVNVMRWIGQRIRMVGAI